MSTSATPTSAEIIADYLIWHTHEHGDLITNLKLQKLLYFAQAWFFTLNGKPLFDNEMEAWVHGPVIPQIYQKFKRYKYNPISKETNKPSLSKKITKHLDEIMKVYGGYSAFQLEHITHQAPPWINARKGLDIDEPSNSTIPLNSVMKNYYLGMANEAQRKDS